ncbi:conserved hypothetical protein [Ricinus communis]|uniref:Uncharacterized protein n=1 Tax=Ricinus communis TaxID=3988 RepID=B9RRK4_RICCO|nr:conserved hypothetical protein [Ricinus communis]
MRTIVLRWMSYILLLLAALILAPFGEEILGGYHSNATISRGVCWLVDFKQELKGLHPQEFHAQQMLLLLGML